MDRLRKLELIQRSLGIRHKLKVHESMKPPETHEELSLMLLSKWELEDELRAIEEILAASRQANVGSKRTVIEREDGPVKQPRREEAAQAKPVKKKKP